MTRRTGLLLGIGAALVAGAVLASRLLPLTSWLTELVDWIRDAGTLGLVVYALVFTAISLSLVPTSPLYVAAGVLYGLLWGTVVMVAFSVLAAAVTFALARTVLRDWVGRRVAADARFAAIDASVGAHAFWIAWLLRFSPVVPFGACNYLLAATKITLRMFLATMVLGTLTGTIVLAYAGSLVKHVDDVGVGQGGTASQVLLWVGLAATVIVSAILGQIAKRALAKRIPTEPTGT